LENLCYLLNEKPVGEKRGVGGTRETVLGGSTPERGELGFKVTPKKVAQTGGGKEG